MCSDYICYDHLRISTLVRTDCAVGIGFLTKSRGVYHANVTKETFGEEKRLRRLRRLRRHEMKYPRIIWEIGWGEVGIIPPAPVGHKEMSSILADQ